MLFDTTFFIDLTDPAMRPVCAAFLRAHRNRARHVSVVTLGEFAVGAGLAETRRTFRGFVPLALGRELAIFSGRLQATLPFEMGENDLWIAGTAMRHGLPLVTRDAAFTRVPGLAVFQY